MERKSTMVVLGAEIERSTSETREQRQNDYHRMAEKFRILAKTCYSHPARNRDYAAKAAAYEVAARLTQ